MAAPAHPFPYGEDVTVQRIRKNDVDVFVFTHQPRLRTAPRPRGQEKRLEPSPDALRLIELVRFGNFSSEVALSAALGWSQQKVGTKRREAMACGLIAWTEWMKHVGACHPRSPSSMTPAHVQQVVELVRSGEYPTQTTVGQRLGLTPNEVSKLKTKAIKGGLITKAAWVQHLQAARDKVATSKAARADLIKAAWRKHLQVARGKAAAAKTERADLTTDDTLDRHSQAVRASSAAFLAQLQRNSHV